MLVTYGSPCHARGHSHAHTCDLWDAMPHQRSLYTYPPPRYDFPGSLTGRNATPEVTDRIPREADDFPRGDKHFKHVPPLTYLIYLSPKDLYR